MKKTKIKVKTTSILVFTIFILSFPSVISVSSPPQMPHNFYGTVRYNNGDDVPNGNNVTAMVDDENYTTTVVNGTYGSYSTFQLNDLDGDNGGKTIYFYVGGINTDQTSIFENGGSTELNLTIDIGSDDDDDDYNPGSGGSSPPGGSFNNLPVAVAKGPYYGIVNQSIQFNGSGSSDPDDDQLTYEWDFGDGTTSTDMSPLHEYRTIGNYDVTLVVNDGTASDADTTNAIITRTSEENQPPIAQTDGPYAGLTFDIINMGATNSYDYDGKIVNYTWDLEPNNIKLFGEQITYTYNNSGIFNISLTVTDDEGLTDTTTTKVAITLDSDGDGWSNEEEQKYHTNETNSSDYPLDNDGDRIPDNFDLDDDNDGLFDKVEDEIGSDTKDSTDTKNISKCITGGFLVDVDKNGVYDVFYNSSSNVSTSVIHVGNTRYKIDIDGDGEFDFIYDLASGTANIYKEKENNSTPLFVYGVILAFAIIVVIALIIYRRRNI